jgi:hypothetical protein
VPWAGGWAAWVAKDDPMQEPSAQRTLVKSPPELWAEVSDIDALTRHLGEFGEIRITRLDPETTVAWEGDRARGTVALEPTAWGTKVTITAQLVEGEAPPEPEPVAAEPEPQPEPEPPEPEPAADPEAAAPQEPEPEPEPLAPEPEPEPLAPEPPAPDPAAAAPEEPAPVADPAEAPKAGFFARLFGRKRKVEAVVEVEPVAPEPELAPIAEAAPPEPELVPEPVAEAAPPEPELAPEPVAEAAAPEPAAPAPLDGERAQAILTGVLDDLGSAHHRPFSRS